VVVLDGLPVAQPAVHQHEQRPSKVNEHEPALPALAGVPNSVLTGKERKSDNADDEKDAGDPEVSVFVPDRLRELLFAHERRLYL